MMQTFKYNKQSLLSNWFPVQYSGVIWLLTTWCWLTLSSLTIINMTCLGSIDRCLNLVDKKKKETISYRLRRQSVCILLIHQSPSFPTCEHVCITSCLCKPARVKFYDILLKLQRHNDEIHVLPPECEFSLESVSCYCVNTFFTLHILHLHVINVMTEKAFVFLCYY